MMFRFLSLMDMMWQNLQSGTKNSGKENQLRQKMIRKTIRTATIENMDMDGK